MKPALSALLLVTLCACSRPAPERADGVSGDRTKAVRDAAGSAPDDAAAGRNDTARDAAQSRAAPGDGAPVADAAAPAAFEGTRIPARFHGVYAAEGACGSAGAESRLVLTGDSVSFHESTGRVVRARGAADMLDVTLDLTGEGEARAAEYRFRREEAGRRLVDASNGMTRVRCDEKAGG